MIERTDRPTFLLGVGAMKAGTTWLHDHLAASPQCAPGLHKEYHVLDALDLASEQWKRDRILRQARRATKVAVEGGPVEAAVLHQASMLGEESLYPAYFAGLLTTGARLAMDITPSYALLSAARLRWVRESFARRGVRVAAVFLMRDPVDRAWSHVRMVQGRRPEQYPRSSEEHLRELFDQPAFEARTRYEHTLARLAEAFEPGEVHLGLYETLFTDEAVAALSRFLGIEAHPARFDVRSNASPRPQQALSEDTERLVAQHFRTTYAAVARALPDLDLAATWPSSRWVH